MMLLSPLKKMLYFGPMLGKKKEEDLPENQNLNSREINGLMTVFFVKLTISHN